MIAGENQPWGIAIEDSKPHRSLDGEHVVKAIVNGPIRASDRRLKIVRVSPDLIVDILNMRHRGPEYLAFPDIPDLPIDAEVRDVRYNEYRRCLDVLLSHSSFPPVPDGEEITPIGAFVEISMFKRIEAPYQQV